MVVRHFLACVSQPAVGAETTVEMDIAGEQFAASGRVIIAVSSVATFELAIQFLRKEIIYVPDNWIL